MTPSNDPRQLVRNRVIAATTFLAKWFAKSGAAAGFGEANQITDDRQPIFQAIVFHPGGPLFSMRGTHETGS
jgi:hypothetical protein